MKTILLSTGVALGLGLLATAPSSAASLPLHAPFAGQGLVSDVACRTVTRRVTRPNGTVRVTRSRVCDRPVYRERRVYRDRMYRPAPRPGVSIRVN